MILGEFWEVIMICCKISSNFT